MTSEPSMSETNANPEPMPQDPVVITGMASEAPDRTFSLLTLASGLPVQEEHPVRIPQNIVDELRIRHGHLLEAEVQQRAKIIAVTGPPGCGKSTCAKQLIKYAVQKTQDAGIGKVLKVGH